MTTLVCLGFSLVPDTDESSNDVSDESSEENEGKELDERYIKFLAGSTHSCYFSCSIADLAAC